MKNTQLQKLLTALIKNGKKGINPMQALEIGIYRLSARILDLRKLGYGIKTDKVGKSKLATYILFEK